MCTFVCYVTGYQPGTHWGGSHTAVSPDNTSWHGWKPAYATRKGQHGQSQICSRHLFLHCSHPLICLKQAHKSVLMTGFPHLKDRETPYVTSTDRKTWRSLENKAAH